MHGACLGLLVEMKLNTSDDACKNAKEDYTKQCKKIFVNKE